MVDNLAYLGIYPEAIIKAIEAAERAIERVFREDSPMINVLNVGASDRLQNIGNFKDITNSVILSYFAEAQSLIEKFSDNETDYFINSYDSHFYINGEEI